MRTPNADMLFTTIWDNVVSAASTAPCVVVGIRDQVSALQRARASYAVACEVTRSRTIRAEGALLAAVDGMERAVWGATQSAVRSGSCRLCAALDSLVIALERLRAS
jgi:hypothetical protein